MEPPVLHAAGEHRDGATDLDVRRWLGDAGESREREPPSRHERPSGLRHERSRDRLERGGRPDERRVGEHPMESEPPDEPCTQGSERLDLLPGRLHHPAERDVGGAHVLACSAHETEIHEALEGLVRYRDPVLDGAHGRDASTGRRRFFPRQPVGRAVRQA